MPWGLEDPRCYQLPGREPQLGTGLEKLTLSQVHPNCIDRSISIHPKTGLNRTHSPIRGGLASRQALYTELPCQEKSPFLPTGEQDPTCSPLPTPPHTKGEIVSVTLLSMDC